MPGVSRLQSVEGREVAKRVDGKAAVKSVPEVGDHVQVFDFVDGRAVPGKVVPVVGVLLSSYRPETHSRLEVEFPDGFRAFLFAYEVKLVKSAQCLTSPSSSPASGTQ